MFCQSVYRTMNAIVMKILISFLLVVSINFCCMAQCPPAPSGGDQPICGPGTVAIDAVTFASSANLVHHWWTTPTGGYPIQGTVQEVLSYPLVSTYTVNVSTPTSYYVSTYNTLTYCECARSEIRVTIQSTPSFYVDGAPLCAPGVARLNVGNAPSGSFVRWVDYSGAQVGTGNVYVTPYLTSNTYYNVTVNSPGYCSVTRRVDVTIGNSSPSMFIYPATVCYGGSTTLDLVATEISGAFYNWFDSNYNLVQSTRSNTDYTTSSLTASTTFYSNYYLTFSQYCVSPLLPVAITVRPQIGTPAGTASNFTFKDNDLVQITATPGANGNICHWYETPGGGVPTEGNTYVPVMAGATTKTFYVASYNKSTQCESADRLPITVNVSPFAAYNYIRENEMQNAGVTQITTIDNLTADERKQNWKYFDGLGRPSQIVSWQASPGKKDVIQPIQYDNFGLESQKFLPYTSGADGSFKADAITAQLAFYSPQVSQADNHASDTNPFSNTQFEASPLSRPLKNYGTGVDWDVNHNNKFTAQQYVVNMDGSGSGQEKIICWKVDLSTGHPVQDSSVKGSSGPGYFPSHQLFIKVTTDEAGSPVREYTNKSGQVILKKVYVKGSVTDLATDENWAQTYFVYDDFGSVAMVIPPEAVNLWLIQDLKDK